MMVLSEEDKILIKNLYICKFAKDILLNN